MKPKPAYKGNTKRRVRCQSGQMGERSRLQSRYTDKADFAAWDESFGLSARLGFRDTTAAWLANPIMESSVNPSDFRVVYPVADEVFTLPAN